MKSCLIVDDSRVVRKVARGILEELSFSCDEAENGEKALEYCEERRPDIILLDWNMPVMDGITFAQTLQEKIITISQSSFSAQPRMTWNIYKKP